MLTVFFGNDTITVREKAIRFLEPALRGEGTTVIDPKSYTPEMLTDLAQGASLFGATQTIVIDTLSEDEALFEDLLTHLSMLKESRNTFVVIEHTLTAPVKKIFEKHAEKMVETKREGGERFNTFALTDALLKKDKKGLWLLLLDAQKAGISNEEMIGVLFWQIKMLRLAERTKSAEEAGQKPFVYQKAKRALAGFKTGELDQRSKELITMYHDGHLGKEDIALALERWVLSL